jgi:hypothetical protein
VTQTYICPNCGRETDQPHGCPACGEVPIPTSPLPEEPYREGEPVAYRPIVCRIGDPCSPVFENHFCFRIVPVEEAGTRIDQRERA